MPAAQSCCGCGEGYCPLRGTKCLFMLHPLANKGRAGDDAEMSTLPACQIHNTVVIQFFHMGQIEQRPSREIEGRGNKLVKISQVALRERAGDANRNIWRNEF